MRSVLQLQLTQWRRDKRLLSLLAAMALALAATSAWSTYSDLERQHAQHEAAETSRGQWEGRGAAHPHSMAHFGDFTFRPSGALANLDRGVQSRLGKVLRIEAHRQGSPLHSDAARAGTVARFAPPDAAFLLHRVVPLLLIFLGALGFGADRTSGRLKLALLQGAPARAVVLGHVAALWGLGLGLLGVVVVSSLLCAALGEEQVAFNAPRLLAFVGVHALFLGILAAAVVAASVWLRTARSALLALLALWVVGTALLPRATSSAATALYPLPSQDAFQASMQEAREAGPDGHNAEDALIEARLQEALAEHGVETKEELPFDFSGIAMQIDEDYGNLVWDEHYGELADELDRQTRLGSIVALANPFQAIDHTSMALAGTDLAHDLDFQTQAEHYRRDLVRALNNEHAYGGQGQRRGWEAPPEFYASLDAFIYDVPTLSRATEHRVLEFVSLLFWLFALLGLCLRGADRVERGGLPC